MKESVTRMFGGAPGKEMGVYFDHIAAGLSTMLLFHKDWFVVLNR